MKNAIYTVILAFALIAADTLLFIFTDLDLGMYIFFVIDSILFVPFFWYLLNKKKKRDKEEQISELESP